MCDICILIMLYLKQFSSLLLISIFYYKETVIKFCMLSIVLFCALRAMRCKTQKYLFSLRKGQGQDSFSYQGQDSFLNIFHFHTFSIFIHFFSLNNFNFKQVSKHSSNIVFIWVPNQSLKEGSSEGRFLMRLKTIKRHNVIIIQS